MPTNTFYNLPKEKQEKVLEAAKEEFFRAKDGNVLVKNIVISAGIPRGSFYQYFESKEDLIDFIIKKYLKATEEKFCKKMDDFNGDILLVFEDMFNRIVSDDKMCVIEKERKVMEHIKRMQEKYGCMNNMKRLPEKMNQNVLLKHIDKSKFKMKDDEELDSVFHVIISMMIKNIIDYQNGASAQNAKKSFKRDLDYLRYGIIK